MPLPWVWSGYLIGSPIQFIYSFISHSVLGTYPDLVMSGSLNFERPKFTITEVPKWKHKVIHSMLNFIRFRTQRKFIRGLRVLSSFFILLLLQNIYCCPSGDFFYRIDKYVMILLIVYTARGGVQNLEWSNVERPIFQNLKITNIKIAKNELFDYFIYEFFFYYYFFKLLEHSKYLIIFPNFIDFLNC